MADNARAGGYRRMVVPVRPTAKHRQPHMPMDEYVKDADANGLPRLHCSVTAGHDIYVEPNVWISPNFT
ncbi:hypothetical protein [Streptomyces canus]|uniref:hypothetical protein n=1 Tax=Streptomyces canus TaxID=58343 RepID=UPI0030E4E444